MMRRQSGGARPSPSVTAAERLSAGLAAGALALAPAVRLARPSTGAQLAARREADRALAAWGGARPARPVLWLHGASAGELLGAAPTVAALRIEKELSLVVTHFSPSGEAAARRLAPDHSGFPPLETPSRTRRAIAGVGPDLLVFAKLDVWPGLVGAAVRGDVPVALINGVVRGGSGRLGRVSRSLLRSTYGRLDVVGAASETDASRLVALGARPEVVRVTGDASFDLALARADAARQPGGARETLEALLPGRPPGGLRLVAGSTWPADEEALLEAIDALDPTSDGRLALQAVIAPHRPTEARVRDLEGRVRARRHPVARLGRSEELAGLPGHGVVIVDEVGLLAELYTAADLAWVGGAMDGRGLHNVLEPAAAGIPVLFGPRHDRREARELTDVGGGFACGREDLSSRLALLLREGRTSEPGGRARAYVESGAGAAAATAALLAPLLGDSG